MKKLNKKGFTIVELVIVIAVIAILSAVLIPTFSSIINKANKSNIDQSVKNATTVFLAEQDDAQIPANTTFVYIKDNTCYEYKVDGGFKQVARALAIDGNDKIYAKQTPASADALKATLNGAENVFNLVEDRTLTLDNFTAIAELPENVYVVVSIANP